MKLLYDYYIRNYYHAGFGGLGADDAPASILAIVRGAIEVPVAQAIATVPGYGVGLGNQSVAFVWNVSQAFIPAFDTTKSAAPITREPERSQFIAAYQAYQDTIAKIFGASAAAGMHNRATPGFIFDNARFGNMTANVVDGNLVLTWARQLLDTANAADALHAAPGTKQDIVNKALKGAAPLLSPISKVADAIKWGGIALIAYLAYDVYKDSSRGRR